MTREQSIMQTMADHGSRFPVLSFAGSLSDTADLFEAVHENTMNALTVILPSNGSTAPRELSADLLRESLEFSMTNAIGTITIGPIQR